MQHFARECITHNLVKTIKVSREDKALFYSLNTIADLADLPS
jgi:hypothetical protein